MANYTLTRSTGEPLTKVFTPRTLTGAEDTYTFTDQRGGITTLELTADVVWSFRSSSGGPSYSIEAGIPFRFPIESTTAFYVISGGAGNITMVALG